MSDSHRQETTPHPLGSTGAFAAAPADGLVLPCSLGHYRLVAPLGQGGIGAVYRAHHTHLNRDVAVKVLRPERANSPSLRARFLREMAALGRLDHPHIVRATDAAEFDGRLVLVMELLDGLDLFKVVARCGPLTITDACAATRQAALGLIYAHERGLIHRDIKPSNLFLTSVGTVKVLDLGLVRGAVDADAADATRTSERVLGTADYMAPEQADDARGAAAPADVYSLGCTLFHLLVGKAPFDDDNHSGFYKRLKAHAEVPPPVLTVRRPDAPDALTALVARMLAKRPDLRPTLTEVTAVLAPLADTADLPTLLEQARGAAGLLEGDEAPTRAGAAPAAPTPSRFRGTASVVALLALVLGAGAVVWLFAVPDPPRPERGVWRPLLTRPPERLQWPTGPPAPRFDFNAERRELFVSVAGRALLSLGTASGDYDLRVTFHQASWEGIGVFFGMHEEMFRGQKQWKYQVVELYRRELVGPQYVFARAVAYRLPGGGMDTDLDQVAEVEIPMPGRRARQLALSVRGGRLAEVVWDGLPLADVVGARADEHFARADHDGTFGLTIRNGTVTVQHAEIFEHPRDRP